MSYWWCPNCKIELDGCNVTYEENCDICGSRVLSVDESVSQEEIEIVIEKQKPKKIEMEERYGGAWMIYKCPICGRVQNRGDYYKYCPDCGQKLDWKL